MTKKKNGFFSNIKNKFKKNKEDHHDDSEDSIDELEFSEDDEFIEDEEDLEDISDDSEIEDFPSTKEQMTASHSELEEDEILDEDEVLASDEEFEEEFEDDEAEYEDEEDDSEVDVSELISEEKKKNPVANLFSKFGKSNKKNSSNTNSNNLINPLSKTSQGQASAKSNHNTRSSANLSDISAEQIIPNLIGTSNQRLIHKTFLVCLAFSTFYVVGKLTGIILSSKDNKEKIIAANTNTPSYSPRSDIMAIKNNNIFNIRENEFEEVKNNTPKEPEVKVCIEANRKTSLPIKLVNSIVLQDSVKSIVSVIQRGKTENYREGEKIGSIAEIGRIDSSKLIFKNLQSGQCEYIDNGDKPVNKQTKEDLGVRPAKKITTPIKNDEIEAEGNKFAIKKSLRDKLLSNIGDVLTQARAIQIKNPDGSLSFKMTEIVPGSIFSNLNIQDGDIITGVQGKKIENVNELMSMFGKLKENDSYELTVKRNGTETNLNYNFVE